MVTGDGCCGRANWEDSYTLRELVHLVRSQVASQRLMALNTLAEIIRKSGPANDGTGGVGAPGDAEAGPVPTVIGAMLELHVPLFLRKAMDDHVAQVRARVCGLFDGQGSGRYWESRLF